MNGYSAVPRRPAHLRTQEERNDLHFLWARRSRHRNRLLGDPVIEPMDEAVERYSVEVRREGATVRSADVIDARSWVYGEADRALDGPQCTVRVAQVGTWGIGRFAEVEAPA